jgi:YbbR domain-containing protein
MRKSGLHKFITKNPWLKVASLLLATALWFFVVSQGHSLIEVDVPIGFKNIPSHLEILNGPKKASITVKGQERLLKKLRQEDIRISIDLSGVEKGNRFFPLSADNVTLPNTLSMTDISPQTVKLRLEERVTKRVPVRTIIVGSPAQGFAIKKVEVTPGMIEIKGTESEIAKIYSVKTEPINITGITGNLKSRAFLDVNDIKVNVPEVAVKIILTETP